MGLFDEVEKLAGGTAGQDAEDSLVQKAVQEGEQLLEDKTGGAFDSEIQKGGDLLEQQLDQHLPNL